MDTPRWIRYTDRHFESYRRLTQAEYGRASYQASTHYLKWLYTDNPHARGNADFLISVNRDEEVVGCIHKMRLPWTIDGRECSVPTLHNLLVKPEYRSGTGFWLLKTSLHGEEHALIPGVVPPLSEAYRHMRCQAISSQWFRRVIRHVQGGLALCVSKLTRGAMAPNHYLETQHNEIAGCRLTVDPSEEQLRRLTTTLNSSAGRDHVIWDRQLVRWRFFQKPGPRHALVESSRDPDAHAVISLGPRSGLTVGRIIVLSNAWIKLGAPRMAVLCDLIREQGAHAVMAMTTRQDCAALFTFCGFHPYKTQPETYFFHRDKKFSQDSILGCEATDIGLESITAASITSP